MEIEFDSDSQTGTHKGKPFEVYFTKRGKREIHGTFTGKEVDKILRWLDKNEPLEWV